MNGFPQRRPHPAKAIIEEAGVSLWQVSQRLSLNYSYTSAILNGSYMPTDAIEEKLKGLVTECLGLIRNNRAAQEEK